MNELEQNRLELLTDIAQCELAKRSVENPSHIDSCSKIVRVQSAANWDSFQIPEPWSGDIVHAPILFFSSNPSISVMEAYPTGLCDPSFLHSYFSDRFNGYWIKDGRFPRNADPSNGEFGAAVRYWSGIRNRATEILGNPSVPGRDYALSEIVHCKSKNESGVSEAVAVCAERYLRRLLRCSGAVLIVLVGKKVQEHWNSLSGRLSSTETQSLPLVPDRNGTRVQTIEGRKRVVAYLGHPTGPEKKRISHWLTPEKLVEIRALLSTMHR